MSREFVSGWHPDYHAAAVQRMQAAGLSYARPGFDTAAIPPACSLSSFVVFPFDQGQAGTCWVNSATGQAQLLTSTSKLWQPAHLSRVFVGWAAKAFNGGSNPTYGGSPTDAMRAMADQGHGACHDELWPYHEDWGRWQLASYLNGNPPAGAQEDGAKFHIHQVADVQSDDEARANIANGYGNAQGQWWPYAWDQPDPMKAYIGGGQYGHSMLEEGYVLPGVWDNYDWWELLNSHGAIYDPLPPDKAAKVPGYKPTAGNKTHTFWVRGDVYRTVQGYRGGFERVTAADVTGFVKRDLINWSDLSL